MATRTLTHVLAERGNGYPQDGEEVVCVDEVGNVRLLKVVESGPIVTGDAMRGDSNSIYLAVEPADRDWDDLSESEQDALYEDGHHVARVG